MQFAGWMHDKRPGYNGHGFIGRSHCAAALETEIDFRRVRMAMVGAGLTWLPASHRHIALGNPAEDALDMLLGVELLFAFEIEVLHRSSSVAPFTGRLVARERYCRRWRDRDRRRLGGLCLACLDGAAQPVIGAHRQRDRPD